MLKVSLIIPCYNEERNISELIKKINLITNIKFEIILIDDFSKQPLNYNQLKKINKNIVILRHKKNFGQSASIFTGILYSNYEIIITMDGDLQNDPSDIIKFIDYYLNKNKKIDLIQGVRINRKDSASKLIASKIANYMRSLILKDNCKDSGCGFRLFKKDSFIQLPYFNHMHRFLPHLFKSHNFSVEYIDIMHNKRLYGKSNYNNIFRFFSGLIDILGVIWLTRRRYRNTNSFNEK